MSSKIPLQFCFKRSLLFIFCILCFSANFSCKRKDGNKNTAALPTGTIEQDLLSYLPPVLSVKPNSDTQSILLTTTDLARYEDKQETIPYVQSIQIVDADAPWPPRWYSALPVYSDEMHEKLVAEGQFIYNFIIDAKIEGGYLAFYKIVSKQDLKVSPLKEPEISGYILLNDKYEPVDTVTAKRQKRRNLFYHDFRINAQKERIVDIRKDTYLDLRDYTDNDKDSTVHCYVDYITILDSNNNAVFSWNPLEHLSPDLFQFNNILSSKSMATLRTDIVECTRLTSAVFDYDGNVIYSMREIGIGKISRQDGSIIWQINYTDIPIIDGKDTIEWYSPHDINPVADNANTTTYSIYSNGKKDNGKPASAVIFEVDKKTFQVKLVRKIKPYVTYVAKGHGNIDYYPKTGSYLLSYGNLSDETDGPDLRIDLEYGTKDSVVGLYEIPKYNSIYKAHWLENWPRPPRPSIIKNGDLLEAHGEMTDFIWYKLSGKKNLTVEKAATGKSIKPEVGATYCVEGKYGIGFSVSRIYVN